jgi:hypothetical protein
VRWLIGTAVVVLAFIGVFLWVARDDEPPTFTCSLPSPEQRCIDTERSILDDFFPAFVPELSGDLIAVDIRSAPLEWSTSVDPGFQAAEWAAWLERDGEPPILAACYYSSDAMVTCHTEEHPFSAPSN